MELIKSGDAEVAAQIIPPTNTSIITQKNLKSDEKYDEIYDISEKNSSNISNKEEDLRIYWVYLPYTKSLLDFAHIDSNNHEEVLRFFNIIGNISAVTGIFRYTDYSSYCLIDPTKIGSNKISILSEKFAWEIISEYVAKKIIKVDGDTLKEQIKNLKAIPGAIGQLRMSFNPRGNPFVKNKTNIVELNTFRPTAIMLKARVERETLGVHKNFSWLSKYPHINLLLDNLCVEEERKFRFLNWLSFCMVTLQKAGTVFLFRGVQGTGKTVLFERIISRFFGKEFCPTLGNDDISSRFTPPALAESLFVCFNEVKCGYGEGNTAYEKLKTYITEGELRLERKGVDSAIIGNHFNAIFFSNNNVPLQIQTSDRRYTVFGTSDENLKVVVERELDMDMGDYLIAFDNEVDPFLCDLFRYDFSEKDAREPMKTDEKEAIQEASDPKQNRISLALKRLDTKFFENVFAKVVDSWGSSKEARDCIEDLLQQTNKITIEPDKYITAGRLEQFLKDFYIYFVTSIQRNNGHAISADMNFLANLFFFDDVELEKSIMSSQKMALILAHDFGKTFQKQYTPLTLSLGENETKNCKVRTCHAWRRYAAQIQAEDQGLDIDNLEDVNTVFPG